MFRVCPRNIFGPRWRGLHRLPTGLLCRQRLQSGACHLILPLSRLLSACCHGQLPLPTRLVLTSDNVLQACTKCPAGTSTLESRSSSQDECLAICMPGTYGIGGLEPCTPCASGTAASVPGALECLPCPAGHAPDAAATDCIPCAPGSFAAAAGTPACHVCPLHTFSATLGATSCEVCPVDAAKVATATQAGEALDSTPTLRTIAPGRTSAAECFVPCSPGEFSPQDGISSTESPCTPCQPGYYSPDFLSVECLPCMVRWPMPRNARPTVTGRMPCQTTHVTEQPLPPPPRAGWHISGQS